MSKRINSYRDVFSDIGNNNTGYVDSKIIKEMIAKVSMVDVLSDMYGLSFDQQTENRFRGHCPFPDHRDSSPSFDVWNDTGTFKCWGCGKSGDLLEFFKLIDGTSFKESLMKLSAISGVDWGNYDSEIAKVLYDIRELVYEYAEERYCQTDLPGGISETEFLRQMTARIRAYEAKVDYDPEEIKWVDRVYELLDTFEEESDYSQLNMMWDQLGKKMKDRFSKLEERVQGV